MKKLQAIITMELLTYRRNRFIYFIVIVLMFYIGIGYYHYLRENYIQAGQMLQSSSYINMAASLLGLFSGAMIAGIEKRINFQELLSSMQGNKVRPYGKIISWLVLNLIINLVVYIEVLIFLKISGSELLFFKKDIYIYILIYWSGVLFTSGILGYFIEVVFPFKWWNIVVITIVWIIISPTNSLFSTIIPKNLLNFLNLGENTIEKSYNDYSGLNVTYSSIMNLFLFLLLSLSILQISLFIKENRKYSKTEKYINFILIAIIILFSSIFFTKSAELHVQTIEDDEYYNYEEQGYKHFYNIIEGVRDFKAESYNIMISFDKLELKYEADLKVTNIEDNVLPFTLYHGLNISSVEVNGKAGEFYRENDWIYVKLTENMKEANILFKIRGNTGEFCPITENSFFLSSTFPWYPVPGIFHVAEKGFRDYGAEFKNIQLNEPAEFHIFTYEKDLIFSNLDRIGSNEFHGYVRSVGLFRGVLISEQIDGKKYIAPPDRTKILKAAIPLIEEKINFISNIIDKPKKNIPEIIIVKPLYSYFQKYNFLYTEDCLFVNNNLRSLTGLADIKGVFRAFFWEDGYNVSNNAHAYVFEMMLEYIQEYQNYNTLSRYALTEKKEYSKSEELAFLVVLSKEAINMFNENPNNLKKLVKIMYERVEKDPNATLNTWLNTIEEIKKGAL